MKIFRWLLSHFFLILLIVAVIYGYMFWGNLLGKDTPGGKALAYLSHEFAEVEQFVNAVKAKQAKLTAEKEQSSDDRPSVSSADTNAAATEKITIEQQPVSISYSHNRMRVKQNSDGEIESSVEMPLQVEAVNDSTRNSAQNEASEKPVIEPRQQKVAENDSLSIEKELTPVKTDMSVSQGKFVTSSVERQLDNLDKNGQVINKALQGEEIREIWGTARKSFYQRNYRLSEQSYQDVIARTTDNFDAYGELGNVYFNQGKLEQAAAAYFEAAAILVRKGQIRRAINLMGILKRLDIDKANELKKLIDASAS